MSPRGHLTEKNAYAYIIAALKDLGWNVKNPNRHPEGKVYTDNQALGHPELKKGLGLQRPENVVKLDETTFWVIESKSSRQELEIAVQEAIDYANGINTQSSVKAVIASGVAGNDDDGYLVRNVYMHKGAFTPICLNGEPLTGLLSSEMADRVIGEDSPDLKDIPVDEGLFLATAEAVNKELHIGAIKQKRPRKGNGGVITSSCG